MRFKKLTSRKRSPTKKSDLLKKRLVTYSATAGAALLAAPVANAAIQNITGLSISLDLPAGGGFQSLTFNAGPFHGSLLGSHSTYLKQTYISSFSTSYSSSPGYSTTIGTYRYGRASLKGNIAGNLTASQLNKGIAFSNLSFSGNSHVLASKSYNGGAFGNFRNQSGYVAFSSNSYYGWLKVKVNLDSNGVPNKISLVDNGNGIYGAYDQISGTVADGFTVGAVAAPEPSTMAIAGLGLLAFGAAGVRELRRRRKVQEKA